MVSSLLLRVGVSILVVGMAIGIAMGIAQDFRVAPAHAHLNLIGGVLLLLAGLYYVAVPDAAASVLAKVHAAVAIIGALVFPAGIAAVLLGGAHFEPFAIGGSLIVFAGMLLFAWIVFCNAPKRA